MRLVGLSSLLLFAAVASAQPAPGETVLVGRAADGTKANGYAYSYAGALNRTGAFVLFLSNATNLDPRVTNSAEPQLYRKDLRTGEVLLVSVAPGGRLGKGVSTGFMSPNGRWVVLSANKLLDEDFTRDKQDTYLVDLSTGDVTLVTKSSSGVQHDGLSYGGFNRVTPDGRYVAFVSTASNLDPAVTSANQGHLYVKDMQTGSLVLADKTADGNVNSGYVFSPCISDDGKRVAFLTSGNLSPQDSGTSWDAYLKDLSDGSIRLISTAADGKKQNRDTQELGGTTDLRFLAFSSNAANLVSNDLNGRYDVFLKDTRTGEVRLVSTASDGTQGNYRSFGGELSDDGRFVTFWSQATNLVPNDTNDQRDTFVKDMLTGECQLVSIASDGTQTQHVPSYYGGISGNGSVVTFVTEANLPGLGTPYTKLYARNTGLVSGATTDLSLLPTDLFIGSRVVLTAKLQDRTPRANVVGESVTFMRGSFVLGTAITNSYGVAKFQWTVPEGFPLGNHNLFASFAGTIEHARDDTEITVVAKPGPVALTVPNKQRPAGQPVVLAATLRNASGAALLGRTVTFYVDGDSVGFCATDATGLAKLEYQVPSSMSVGVHEIKASFAGDATHTSKTSLATLTVT